jgi:histone deacetylase 1/2
MPNPKYAHVATLSTPSPPPSSVRAALRDPDWKAAMQDEFNALQANGTWTLVPRPSHANVITGKWLFKNKLNPDGSLERRKARWVVRGFSQRPGVDFHQTFSPVVKPATIRTVLHLAATRRWPVHQLDVKNAFLHGDLTERVYCHQPAGFVDSSNPNHVCLLVKSLYRLKQAPRAWFQRLGGHLHSMGFTAAGSDNSLFIYRQGEHTAYLLVYVDDIILTASTTTLLRHVIDHLRQAFAIKDLGSLHFFLGVQVHRNDAGFFLTQAQYTEDILERAGMANCKPATTPVDTKPKVSTTDGDPATDGTFYRSITGALHYLTLTRPDIAYAVNQACLHMQAPRDAHWNLVKRILRYLRGSINHGILISANQSTELLAYSDADWAGCPDTRRSTSGYCVFLGDSLVSWSSKRQTTVSRSSAEAEYRAVANAAAECCWLRNLLHELHVPIAKATVIYCDNVSAVYMSENPVHHRRTKHVELDIHFVREKVALGQFKVLHIPTRQQFADIMTKGLPTPLFNEFRDSLCIRSTEASTAGGCQRPILHRTDR